MKHLLTLLVLTLSFSAFANEHEKHAEKTGGANMNLFPPPQADRSKVARPGKPELVEPSWHSKIAADAITLKWNAVATADAYHVQVATDPNFKWLVSEQQLHKGTTLDVKGLQAGTHYFWRVAALKTDNTPSYMKGWYASSEFEKP